MSKRLTNKQMKIARVAQPRNRIKAQASHGTGAGQWSARKAQALAKAYKKAGGGYK